MKTFRFALVRKSILILKRYTQKIRIWGPRSGVRIRPPRKKTNFKCSGVWRRYGRYQDRMAEINTSVNKVSRSISRHIVPQWESFPFWRRHPSGMTLRLLAFITLNQLKTSNFTQPQWIYSWPPIRSCDTSWRLSCFDSCQLTPGSAILFWRLLTS